MRAVRIIPRLDIKGPNLVKGVHMEGLRVLGKPEDFAYQYYRDGADELIYIDTVASLYGRNNLLDIVRRTAEKIFIPLTVGGGIRTVDDIKNVLRAGADKVSINTAAINNPNLIKEGAAAFGSQCIVVSIDAKKRKDGTYEAMTDNGRQETGVDVFKWARKACELGAGEILITSIDRDGTGDGYDIELISKISDIVSIPVIASGGAGRYEHIEEVIANTDVSAVSCASLFHYDCIKRNSIDRSFDEGNTYFLKKFSESDKHTFRRIQPLSLSEVKSRLAKKEMTLVRTVAPRVNIKRSPGKESIVVVDFGCGNLFSVKHALKEMGARFEISSDPKAVERCDKLLIPGVGSFNEGMKNLRDLGLVGPIKAHARAGKPILGICLGMQLLLSTGEEFGEHEGLDLIKGKVIKLQPLEDGKTRYKIPHIGWNSIVPPGGSRWQGTILENVPAKSLMYFIHSYIAVPQDRSSVLAQTEYGGVTFCSVVSSGKTYGCQFHPERSANVGLGIYGQFIFDIKMQKEEGVLR